MNKFRFSVLGVSKLLEHSEKEVHRGLSYLPVRIFTPLLDFMHVFSVACERVVNLSLETTLEKLQKNVEAVRSLVSLANLELVRDIENLSD